MAAEPAVQASGANAAPGQAFGGAASLTTVASAPGPGAQLWAARNNGGGASSLGVSPDGSKVFVTGQSGRGSSTVAYSAATGSQSWAVSFAGSVGSLSVSPDGARVFVTGQRLGSDGFFDYATVAYAASSGKQLWVASYDSPGRGQANASDVAVSPDARTVFVTGVSPESGGYEYATVAYDAATGRQLWVARYAGLATGSSATAIGVSRDGTKVFVTGTSATSSSTGAYATVAYNASTGSQLWVTQYSGVGSGNVPNSLAVSPDGTRVFVTGESSGAADPYYEYATVAYDASTGKQLWATRYDFPGGTSDIANSVGVSPDGTRVFVTGYSEGPGSTSVYATVAYTASTGSQLWVSRLQGTQGYARSLSVSPDGTKVFVTGTVGGTYGDYGTVAYAAAAGTQLWLAQYNGPGNGADSATSLGVSPDGSSVFVTGSSCGSGCRYRPVNDYATVAYSTR